MAVVSFVARGAAAGSGSGFLDNNDDDGDGLDKEARVGGEGQDYKESGVGGGTTGN